MLPPLDKKSFRCNPCPLFRPVRTFPVLVSVLLVCRNQIDEIYAQC